MTHREPAASRKQCQLIQTTPHGTAQVYNTALKHAQIFQYEEFFALFNLLLWPADNLPDRKKGRISHRSSSIRWKCHPTVCICASSLPMWHFAVFPCLAATSVIRGHNVFSVLLYQMSLKTFFMTHTTYTPSSAWKYHLHAHNTALSKTIAPGNWGILTRSKAKTNLGNEYFPQYLGPHP